MTSDDASIHEIPWLRATSEDFKLVQFETPIKFSRTTDASELAEAFRLAMGDSANDSSETRVYSMLSAICNMHFKPYDKNEPFGPMFQSATGRSAVPSDYIDKVDQIDWVATHAQNPVLRARTADLGIVLRKSQVQLGIAAVAAYLEIIDDVRNEKRVHRFDSESHLFAHQTVDLLRRALQLSKMTGWEKPQSIAARDRAADLWRTAFDTKQANAFYLLSKLNLDYGVCDAVAIAESIETSVQNMQVDDGPDRQLDLWRLAARAYHIGRCEEDAYRCQSEAAECMVATAERVGSAMLASHELSNAIAELHGIPGKKDRRTELRHKLIDVQSRLGEEMSSFSHKMDIQEVVEQVEDAFRQRDLKEKLFGLITISDPPELDVLREEAIDGIRKFPLSSLFGASHHDAEGKVIFRSSGGGLGEEDNSAIDQQLFRAESIRRQFEVAAKFDPIRRSIIETHFISDHTFEQILRHSPFVPDDILATFSHGFARYFQGDMIGALYILTPLLENSLRHVLKSNGEDVTKFDDATQTQEDRTISFLFERMRTQLNMTFSTALIGDIERLFLRKPGPYLRHALSHGLLHDGNPYGADAVYGCWLILKLCLIPLYPYRENIHFHE